jgi:hypothetical protein
VAVKVAVGSVVLLNWLNDKLGPLSIDHAPVPVPVGGVFAASVVEGFVMQIF